MAGMALRRRGTSHNNGAGGESDDVQRSIELLDRVLSEFDDVENANQLQNNSLTTSISTPQLVQQHPSTTNTSTIVLVGCNDRDRNTGGVVVTGVGDVATSSTPDDESPSLGHQSEDDGYMSMNGRKAKFNLQFKPLVEVPPPPAPPPVVRRGEVEDFPPPPEEAQRLIATLLPKVSPVKKVARSFQPPSVVPILDMTIPPPQKFQNQNQGNHTSATQTTLPKTRHQRPYGWEQHYPPPQIVPPPPQLGGYRCGSLPFNHHYSVFPLTSPTRGVPPRTVPITALERHREVRRRPITDDHFSDDSLEEEGDDEEDDDEEVLPPPPPIIPPPEPVVNKRASIAWEVSLDDDDDIEERALTPGSTKVVGRRRRKSGGSSSTSSIPNKVEDSWPDPPISDEDGTLPIEITSGTSTYVIRRGAGGKKKERKSVLNSNSSLNSRLSSDLSIPVVMEGLSRPYSRLSVDLSPSQARELMASPKSRLSLDLRSNANRPVAVANSRQSTTFDNIRSLIKEAQIESYTSPPSESTSGDLEVLSPQIVRVVSLPTLQESESAGRREVTLVEEEEEDNTSRSHSSEISPLRQIEQNITELLERRDIEVVVQDGSKCLLNGVDSIKCHKNRTSKTPTKPLRGSSSSRELQKSNSHDAMSQKEEYYRQLLMEENEHPSPHHKLQGKIQKSESAKVLGPDSDHIRRGGIQKSESAKEMLISRSLQSAVQREPVLEFPPLPPSPVEEVEDEYSEIGTPQYNSQKTRSMDSSNNYNRRRSNNSFYPGTSSHNRRTFHKRGSGGGGDEPPPLSNTMQTSCSLPETPIFARGCDIPRTPHRRAPDVPQTTPRQSNTVGSLSTLASSTSGGGFRRGTSSSSGLERAIVGAELLRMAGGPGRGWYPKQRHRRPVSIEHLDRVASGHNPWEGGQHGGGRGGYDPMAGGACRKPLTLPPNLTPKFFQRSPRDALRRVTSLLIRKGNGNGGNGTKEKSSKDHPPHVVTISQGNSGASVAGDSASNHYNHHQEPAHNSTSSGSSNNNGNTSSKKRSFFKSFWKRSRHYSLEQQ